MKPLSERMDEVMPKEQVVMTYSAWTKLINEVAQLEDAIANVPIHEPVGVCPCGRCEWSRKYGHLVVDVRND